jgi:hypothetical protein
LLRHVASQDIGNENAELIRRLRLDLGRARESCSSARARADCSGFGRCIQRRTAQMIAPSSANATNAVAKITHVGSSE